MIGDRDVGAKDLTESAGVPRDVGRHELDDLASGSRDPELDPPSALDPPDVDRTGDVVRRDGGRGEEGCDKCTQE